MPASAPPRLLTGRVVAITGAGRGIGRSYALAMAREGARVVVNDLGTDLEGSGADPALADAVVEEIRDFGAEAVASPADVASEAGARSIIATAERQFGRLDALINNAAIEFRGRLEEHSLATLDRVLAVNVAGTFNCTRAAIPLMRSRGGGMILNTTSGSFWEGTECVAAYSASKAAVFSLTLTQHTELAAQGISSNCVAPNATRTRMLDSWIARLASDRGDSGEAGTEEEIMREWGIQNADNLAPLAVYLCSEAGRKISGRIFEVAGDRIALVSPPGRGRSIRRDGVAWSVGAVGARLAELLE